MTEMQSQQLITKPSDFQRLKAGLKKLALYVIAIIAGGIIGEIFLIIIASIVYLVFGKEITSDALASLVIVMCQGIVTGCVAGWIAGRRENLVAVLANFFILAVLLIFISFKHVELLSYIHGGKQSSEDPMLLSWVGIVPSFIGGNFAKKTGRPALIRFLLRPLL